MSGSADREAAQELIAEGLAALSGEYVSHQSTSPASMSQGFASIHHTDGHVYTWPAAVADWMLDCAQPLGDIAESS